MNFSQFKAIAIPEGNVKKIVSGGVTLWEKGYTNMVPLSIDTDGSIYNGVGYMEDYRMNSSGAVVAMDGAVHSGYVPMTPGDVLRAAGTINASYTAGGNYITLYDASFNRLRTETFSNAMTYFSGVFEAMDDTHYMTTFDTAAATVDISSAAYFRISMASCAGSDFIITVNEEIV